jgi:hypothetical protein
VQNATKISPGDQFEYHFVTMFCSTTKTKSKILP